MSSQDVSAIHALQAAYAASLKSAAEATSIAVRDTFVRSMRSIGYRTTATAVSELVDNAIEAGATNVHIYFRSERGSAKPTSIAVVDDGCGMVPEMVRASVLWGGTHREGSTGGFGRFGYGLPSACVSQGRSFSVYSRTGGSTYSMVTLDVDELSSEAWAGIERLETTALPDWLAAASDKGFSQGTRSIRTAVVIDRLDRTTWKTARALNRNLLRHLGLTYRNYLAATTIRVGGTAVRPIDPLFTTPGALFCDLDKDRAESVPSIRFVAESDDGAREGEVTVRLSYLPPTFHRRDKAKPARFRSNQNERFPIMKAHNGLIITRNGRQIGVVTRGAPVAFTNYDRNVGIEVDFPPELDDEFGIDTSKQGLQLSRSMWRHLDEARVWLAVEHLRRRLREARDDLVAQGSANRLSERAMEGSAPLLPNSTRQVDEIERMTQSPNGPDLRHFRVHTQSSPGAPFFRTEQRGSEIALILNTSHRFFSDVYASIPGRDGDSIRSGLEILLFVLGDCELGSVADRELFYESERFEWSRRLSMALGKAAQLSAEPS